MYRFSQLVEYLIVLQITTQIPWIFCHISQKGASPDYSRGANIDLNTNEINSSYNTVQSIKPSESRFEKLTDKARYLIRDHENEINNHYSDINRISERNAHSYQRLGKKKQLIKHKKPSDVKFSRTHKFRTKSKKRQSKIKLNNIRKYDYQGSLLYDKQPPLENNKSKYNSKYGVDISYKNLKNIEISKENAQNKMLSYDGKKETMFDKGRTINTKDVSDKGKDESYKGINGIMRENKENIIEQSETEQTDNKYGVTMKNSQQFHHQNGRSKSSDGYAQMGSGHKLNQNKLTDKEINLEDTERSNKESKQLISNKSKTKLSVPHLSEKISLSVKSRTSVEHKNHPKTDTAVLSLHNKNRFHENSSDTLNDEGSDNDDYNEEKNASLSRKKENFKLCDFIQEKDGVLESKENVNKISASGIGFDETHTPNEELYSKLENENSNTSLFGHANLKVGHFKAQNYHEQDYDEPNHGSFKNSKKYGLKNMKPRKRSKKKSSFKSQHAPTSEYEKKSYENSNRDPAKYDSDLYIEENPNSLKHAKHLRQDIANTRNQRDIKKRLNKHNNYYNDMVQEGNTFSYLANNDENEDLNIGEVEKNEDSYNAKYDDISEHQRRKAVINFNNNDKYSYKESLEENAAAMNDEKHAKIKYGRKKTFSRQSHDPRQKGDNKDKCVEYKAEKVTKKSTCATISTTDKCTTKGTTCATKRNTLKNKTTPQTCNKSLTTKNIEPESGKNSSITGELDTFEKYLSGQLTDDFIDAVINKVKRSRKIYKELGFRNDSEETCDRCIETRPNKMPDMETMKISLGKCLQNNERKSNCYMCNSVPRQMEKVLNLLVLFEQEHENSAYNKIRDDSSFIFTGDYPEQCNQNENSAGNKYTSNRDSFSKETFDKQDLREDSDEEKQDDPVANRSASEDEDTTLEAKNKHGDYSTELEVSKKNNLKTNSNTKSNDQNGIKNRGIRLKSKVKSSLNQDEKGEENDSNDEFDMNVSQRSKYTSLKGPETDKSDDSFNRATTKQRRKALLSDKLLGQKVAYITHETNSQNEDASNRNIHHRTGELHSGYNDNTPYKDTYDYENQHLVPNDHGDISTYENYRPRHNRPYQYNSGRPHSENKQISLVNYAANQNFSPKRNHFGYSLEDDNDKSDRQRSQNNGHSAANSFMSTGWDSNEYQLMPKHSDCKASEHNMLSSVPRKRYYSDYEERLNMVKRESEPSYEEEPLFFEIPNIEYDLY